MTENGRKRRGHSRFIVFFVLIIAALGGVIWGGYNHLRQADWLTIKDIRFTGNKSLSAQILSNQMHKYLGRNLVDVSSREISKDLKKLKRIERIRITRLFPSTLKIKIVEREGFVFVKSLDGDVFPVDSKGVIIEHAVFPIQEDLPVVHTNYRSRQLLVGRKIGDPFVIRVLQLQKLITEVRPDFVKRISEYYQEDGIIYLVDAEHGTRIILDKKNLNDQLRRYEFVQENGDIDKSAILDLRFNNQVVVKTEEQ